MNDFEHAKERIYAKIEWMTEEMDYNLNVMLNDWRWEVEHE